MRLWQLGIGIGVASVILALARDPVGRVATIVFFTALGEFALGCSALLVLFRAVAAIGEARGVLDHVEAVAVTTTVLALASIVMAAWLFAGAWLVRVSVD